MPDYSACENISCKQRGNCGRYLMIWGPRQSVSEFPSVRDGREIVCEYQMPLNDVREIPFKIQSLALADANVMSTCIANKIGGNK